LPGLTGLTSGSHNWALVMELGKLIEYQACSCDLAKERLATAHTTTVQGPIGDRVRGLYRLAYDLVEYICECERGNKNGTTGPSYDSCWYKAVAGGKDEAYTMGFGVVCNRQRVGLVGNPGFWMKYWKEP